MTWWCVTITEPWTWSPRAYPGIWISVLLLAIPYAVAMLRRSGPNPRARHHATLYGLGVAVYWLATDWPIGTLGAGYLASVHMFQFVLYGMIAVPLMMLGTPEWMARRVLERLRLYRVAKVLAKPLVAGVLFNTILLLTHAPMTVDAFRSNQFGSFALDAAWVVGGLILWTPMISPLEELRAKGYFPKMVYIFLAGQVIPMIPGGFLTFSDFPLYSTYELAPRTFALTARHDQQLAGVIMKLGGMPIVWSTMAVLMFRWGQSEGHIETKESQARRKAARAKAAAAADEKPVAHNS